MVLSPIEPVAPSTVTDRTADATALLLRNGTALMSSPNHKTAADAIDAAAQNPDKSRQRDRGNEPVETVEQPAMAGDDLAGILHAEPAFHCRFKEIAELRGDREYCCQQQQRPRFTKLAGRKSQRDHQARDKTTHRPRPGLLGTDARPEFGAANAAAREIAADIGDPHHEQNEH